MSKAKARAFREPNTEAFTSIPLIHLLAMIESRPHTMIWNSTRKKKRNRFNFWYSLCSLGKSQILYPVVQPLQCWPRQATRSLVLTSIPYQCSSRGSRTVSVYHCLWTTVVRKVCSGNLVVIISGINIRMKQLFLDVLGLQRNHCDR
jgi:hypothetical protein